MFKSFRKGQSVKGRYQNVDFTGIVMSVRSQDWTGLVEMDIDFPAAIDGFRGGPRTGLLLTNLGEDDFVRPA